MSYRNKIIIAVSVYVCMFILFRETVWNGVPKTWPVSHYKSRIIHWWSNGSKSNKPAVLETSISTQIIWRTSTTTTVSIGTTENLDMDKHLLQRQQENSSSARLEIPDNAQMETHQNETYYKGSFKEIGKYTDLMATAPIKFLPNFKNPCWIERRDTRSPGFSGKIRCLPSFFVPGFPKCGTTDIYYRLITHPDIEPPCVKEPHWWTRYRHKGSVISGYLYCYQGASNKISNNQANYELIAAQNFTKITLDCSASTIWDQSYWKHIPQNNIQSDEPKFTNADAIHRFLPDAKFIVIMRNPTERLYSDYMAFSYSKLSPEVFHEKVKKSIMSMENCFSKKSVRSCLYNHTLVTSLEICGKEFHICGKEFNICGKEFNLCGKEFNICGIKVRVHIGVYNEAIQDWFKLYPRSQFLFLKTEEYSQRISQSIIQMLKFINLEIPGGTWLKNVAEIHRANTRPKGKKSIGSMLPKTKTLLDDFYRPFNKKLIRLLNDDRFNWTISV